MATTKGIEILLPSYSAMDTNCENSVLPAGESSLRSANVVASASVPLNASPKVSDLPVTSSWADQVEKAVKSNVKISARYFVVKRVDGSLEKVSPFLINKSFESFVGDINIKKLKSGELLVQVKDDNQAMKIQKMNQIGNIPITVSMHSHLNTSRGVMSEYELVDISENEILENLRDQNVIAVKRITIRRDGNIIKTKHIILTFGTPNLPSSIKAGYLRCSIRPFIPNPLRCFKCQRFGHSQQNCRGKLMCARCGIVGHESEGCRDAVCCVNCKNDHPAYSRTCEKWIFEKEIQAVRTERNMSYIEARRLVESRTPKSGMSYAAAATTSANKSVRNMGTQTASCAPISTGLLVNGVRQPPMYKVMTVSSASNTSTSEVIPDTSPTLPSSTPSSPRDKPKTVISEASGSSENVSTSENKNTPSGVTPKYASMIKKQKVIPSNPVESRTQVKQQKRSKTDPIKSYTQTPFKKAINPVSQKQPLTKDQFLKESIQVDPALTLHASDEDGMSTASESENSLESSSLPRRKKI